MFCSNDLYCRIIFYFIQWLFLKWLTSYLKNIFFNVQIKSISQPFSQSIQAGRIHLLEFIFLDGLKPNFHLLGDEYGHHKRNPKINLFHQQNVPLPTPLIRTANLGLFRNSLLMWELKKLAPTNSKGKFWSLHFQRFRSQVHTALLLEILSAEAELLGL